MSKKPIKKAKWSSWHDIEDHDDQCEVWSGLLMEWIKSTESQSIMENLENALQAFVEAGIIDPIDGEEAIKVWQIVEACSKSEFPKELRP